MSNEEIAELLKYSNSKELFIINHDNRLELLKCPFTVVIICDIGVLKRGNKKSVEEVKITKELKTVFIIDGLAYFYYYFEIASNL